MIVSILGSCPANAKSNGRSFDVEMFFRDGQKKNR
jgi:hypothetical protein